MAVCDTCGETFDERSYRLAIPNHPGRYHSVDCAARAYRTLLKRQYLILTYGVAQAELMLRAEQAPAPDAERSPV